MTLGTMSPAPAVYRLTVAQYHQMICQGILCENDRVELIGGVLVAKMTKNEPHIAAVKLAYRVLDRLAPEGWHVAQDAPVVIEPHDEPEPDLSLVRGAIRDYLARKPGPPDVALLIEVSDSSYAYDRSRKLAIYAAAAFPQYWIINLAARRLEAFRDPTGPAPAADYRQCATYGPDDLVPVAIEGTEVGQILVRDLLP